jgi:ribulose-bisphosphate carboxylase small chain
MFGETSIERILEELEACHRANPGNHVRLLGYDNFAQSQGTAFIVYRAGANGNA